MLRSLNVGAGFQEHNHLVQCCRNEVASHPKAHLVGTVNPRHLVSPKFKQSYAGARSKRTLLHAHAETTRNVPKPKKPRRPSQNLHNSCHIPDTPAQPAETANDHNINNLKPHYSPSLSTCNSLKPSTRPSTRIKPLRNTSTEPDDKPRTERFQRTL